MPGLAWFAYRASPLVQVVIAGSSSPEHAKDSVTAYAPMTRLENDGSGGLITSLWESAEHIPKDIWLQYVVPQMASYSALGIPSYCGWIAKDAFYMARGHVYVDGVIDQSYGVRIGNTRHSVISQRDDKV